MNDQVDPRHQKLMQATERFKSFADEFHGESDRGCAVLVLCVLEDALRDMFAAFIPDPNSDKLNNLAPPGRLRFAIENAVLLGLLSQRQARSFQSLATVRNKFAHGVLNNQTFETKEISSAVRSIEPIVDLPPEHLADLKGRDVRRQFLLHAGFVWLLVVMRSAFLDRLPPAGDPDLSNLPPGFPGMSK